MNVPLVDVDETNGPFEWFDGAERPEPDAVPHRVTGPAGTAEQARFFQQVNAWTDQRRIPTFYFEAFDEPWKGSADPREIEKHWGLFDADRAPKPALEKAP